ncbi:MAG: amidase [Rhodobacteraceae bacterium]|nr:amidase [Paracoccaceae bacterium]
MANEWLEQSASDLGRAIGASQIDAVELAECFLDAIAQHELNDQIYARLSPNRALAEAKAAAVRAASGSRRGLLDGVPISWKDLFDTAGIGTEAGSALLRGRVPEQDAKVVRNATSEGLICLGKTHMSELAFSGLGLNPVTASPPCVNDLNAVSGGSSSGAATSVAFGLAAAGIGSDTGGSVRIPSAWNDLVGLKTTSGLVSLEGVVPLCVSFDTVGPLCRTVEDAANIHAVLQAEAPVDLTGADLSGTHFAVCKTLVLDDLEGEVADAFDASLSAIGAAGAKISEIELPSVSEIMLLSGCLFTTEAYATWQTEIEAHPELMYHEILERFSAGRNFTGVEYVASQKKMLYLRREYYRQTMEYDAVLMPTSPLLPPNRKRLESDSQYYINANLLALRNTRVGNLMGLCGLNLPTGRPSCGLMVLGAPFSERKLLRLGAALADAI